MWHLWYSFFQKWNGIEYYCVTFHSYQHVYDILFSMKNMNDNYKVFAFLLYIKYHIYKQRYFHDNMLSDKFVIVYDTN